eukprot:2032252-Rhodomonas_salina.1
MTVDKLGLLEWAMAPQGAPLPEAVADTWVATAATELPSSPDHLPPPELTEGRRQFLLLPGVLQRVTQWILRNSAIVSHKDIGMMILSS